MEAVVISFLYFSLYFSDDGHGSETYCGRQELKSIFAQDIIFYYYYLPVTFVGSLCGCYQLSVLSVFSLSSTALHIKETEDNEAVVSTVIDLHRLIKTKHLPAVQGWVQVVFNTYGSDI